MRYSTASPNSHRHAHIVKSMGLKLVSQWKQRPRLVRGFTADWVSLQRGQTNTKLPLRILQGQPRCLINQCDGNVVA